MGEAVTQLKQDFWKDKIRTSAAERTWSRLRTEKDQLPQAATLTMDLLVAVGDQQTPGSRTRQEPLKVFKRLADLMGVDGTERLDAIKTPYEPGVPEEPSDEKCWRSNEKENCPLGGRPSLCLLQLCRR